MNDKVSKLNIKNDFSGSRLVFFDDEMASNNLADFLLKHKQINPTSIFDFLLFGSVLPPASPLLGVSQLYPSESRADNVSSFEYNQTDFTVHKKSIDYFVDKLDELLAKYFSEHKDIDGILLSGGIDSAILASYISKDAKVITWGGEISDGREVSFAQKTSEKFGFENHHVVFADYEKDMLLFKEVVKKMNIPILFNSSIPFIRMSDIAKELGVKKLLIGQNADTLCMSYPAPVYTKFFSRLNKFLPFNPLFFLKRRQKHLLHTKQTIEILAYFKSLGVFPGEWISVPSQYFKDKQTFIDSFKVNNIDQKIILTEELLSESRRNQICQNEIPALFGIMSMCPFYQKEIVELMLSVPKKIRKKENYGKVILRKLAEKRGVPYEVIHKQKSGLSYKIADLVNQDQYKTMWDIMEKDQLMNCFVDIHSIRASSEKNYLLFVMLSSLYYWFEIVAKPAGLKVDK